MTADEATRAVIEALNSLQLPYMLVGSLSSNYYGIVRATLQFMVPEAWNCGTAALDS